MKKFLSLCTLLFALVLVPAFSSAEETATSAAGDPSDEVMETTAPEEVKTYDCEMIEMTSHRMWFLKRMCMMNYDRFVVVMRRIEEIHAKFAVWCEENPVQCENVKMRREEMRKKMMERHEMMMEMHEEMEDDEEGSEMDEGMMEMDEGMMEMHEEMMEEAPEMPMMEESMDMQSGSTLEIGTGLSILPRSEYRQFAICKRSPTAAGCPQVESEE